MSKALDDFRLSQARQMLADNAARAKLPDAQRAACVRMQLILARIARDQRRWELWRAAENDAERGGSGL
jgi:hypothetical protein